MEKLIAVLALWRDSANHMERTLEQLSEQEKSLSYKYSFVYSFYENDSKDNTVEILTNWLNGRIGFLNSEKRGDPNWGSIAFKRRTQYMAEYRNLALEALVKYKYSYLFVIDTDIVYKSNFLEQLIDKLEANSKLGIITPNTIQFVPDQFGGKSEYSYFDSFALIDRNGNHGISFSNNPFILKEDRISWANGLGVVVNSAFGGAALIRGNLMRNNNLKWNGDEGCEHWKLCQSIKNLNYSVVVDPLINAEALHYRKVNIDFFKVKYDLYRLRKNNLRYTDKFFLVKSALLNLIIFLFSSLIKMKTFIKGITKIITIRIFH